MTEIQDGQAERGPEATRAKEFAALPEWLQRLATESWQVELLISGFAIVGTFSLVEAVEPMATWLLLDVRFEYVAYLRWVLYYLAVGFVTLPAIFVAHFAFRTYWVGLVSLASVYPHGFGSNFGTVPEWVARDTEARSPSLTQQIAKVERRSSVMFAVAALSAMVFVSIAVAIGILFGLGFALDALTEGLVSLRAVFIAFGAAALATYLVTIAVLLLKRYHDRAGLRSFYLRLNRVSRVAMYTVFEQPATYLITLLTTNVHSWRAALGPIVLGYVVLQFSMAWVLTQPATRYLLDTSDVVTSATRADVRRPNRYREEWTDDMLVVNPSIQREIVDPAAGPLLLSLPMLGEDEFHRDELYPAPPEEEDLPFEDLRVARSARRLRAGRRYWRTRVGDVVVPLDDFAWGAPAGQAADGYVAYVDLSGLPAGPHVLSLETARDTGYAPRAVIPFRLLDN